VDEKIFLILAHCHPKVTKWLWQHYMVKRQRHITKEYSFAKNILIFGPIGEFFISTIISKVDHWSLFGYSNLVGLKMKAQACNQLSYAFKIISNYRFDILVSTTHNV